MKNNNNPNILLSSFFPLHLNRRYLMLRINKIEPTLFFIQGTAFSVQEKVFLGQDKNDLLQAVDIYVENTGEPVEVSLDVKIDSEKAHIVLDNVEQGEQTYRVYLPDVRKQVNASFTLKVGEEVKDRHEMTWMPQRHWEVYMIPIAHHDFGYTHTIEKVLDRYAGFYDNILGFCEETDDWPFESQFRYMVEEAWSIQHFVENRSEEVIQKFAKYSKEGRIEVPALFGNEISALCGHEELIRLMYPSFRMKRKYGAPIRTASITDIPGLSWGLPTVLAGAGVKYFFAGLPTYFEWGRSDIHTFWDEDAILRHGRPDAFWWEGPDGEKVLVFYQGSYGCWSPSSYQDALDSLPGMLTSMEEGGCPFSVIRYGGYGCGDNTPPDIRVSHIVREWNSQWVYPKLFVGTNSMFFESLEKQCESLRTFRGELPHTDYVVGAVSSAKETGINRITHSKLHTAEKFATIASLVSDYSYPENDLREAYDNLLLYDEHTWGMAHQIGEVQDWNWNDKSRCAYKAAGLTQSILSGSLNRIADEIELPDENGHIIVFNSLSFQRTDVVHVPRFLVDDSFDLIDDETGERVAYQIVELDNPQAPVPYSAHRYARGGFDRPELFELVFIAKDVPPLGYKTYRLVPKDESTPFSNNIVVEATSLENRFFRVTLNPQNGFVESIYDKELKREIVDKNAPHELNQIITRWVKTGDEESPANSEIIKGQNGAVYGSLIVTGDAAGCPQRTQEIVLYEDIKRIDIRNRLLKDSTPSLEIYFAFPFLLGLSATWVECRRRIETSIETIENPNFRFEGSNSVIEPLVDQFPGSNTDYYTMQNWADVSDGEVGVTFSSIEAHLVEFGGLWPGYVSQAHHGVTPPYFEHEFLKPGDLTKGYIYSYVLNSNFRTNFQPTQQGDMLFRYSISTHKGDWKEGKARNFGWSISNPLIPIRVNGKQEGKMKKSSSFCQVDKPNVLVLTSKRAEDGDGIIVRLIETEGEDTTVTLTLPFLTIREAHQTNLVEENEEILPAQEHSIALPIKAFGIRTIRIK